MNINKVDVQRGWSWATGGWRLVKKDISLWAGMGLIFMLIAIVLKLIPFIGLLLLVLLSPMVLAGATQTTDNIDQGIYVKPAASGSGLAQLPQRMVAWFQYSAGRLFSAFTEEDKVLPLMVISTLTLGTVVVINILAVLLKVDGSAMSAMFAGSVGPRIWVPALIGWLLVLVLQLVVVMGVLYAVPLILFRRDPPLVAIEKSFIACKHNLMAVIVFGLPFLVISMLISALFFTLPFPRDYLSMLMLGWLTVPFFVTGLYRSYWDIFGR